MSDEEILARDDATPPDPSDTEFWETVRRLALAAGSNGCTGVPDFYAYNCWLHDLHYRFGHDLSGRPLSRDDADRRLRLGIQARSLFGILSPMSWWRWFGVRLFGGRSWNG